MSKVIITDKVIQATTPDNRSEFHVWDSQLPGFGVRVRKRSLMFRFFDVFLRRFNREQVEEIELRRPNRKGIYAVFHRLGFRVLHCE
jgi:hypothetical protein